MDRRALLRGLLALPALSALDRIGGVARALNPQTYTGGRTLRVVLDGALAVVLQTDRRWGVRVFTPRDCTGQHQFYFFHQDHQGSGEPAPSKKPYHFELQPAGLKPSRTRPEIDPALCDFTASTDMWCQSDYAVTIDLPAPKRIGFLRPLAPVHFKHSQKRGCMPFNHYLEYDVADWNEVAMESNDGKPFRPMKCEEQVKRYLTECGNLQKRYSLKGADSDQIPDLCRNSTHFENFCRPGDLTFFFGVGLPADSRDLQHPVAFFNERILESFPRLRGQLEIDWIGRASDHCKSAACSSGEAAESSILREETTRARIIEASSVVDCHVSGPVVTVR